jgi:hypothetical protein
MYFKIRNEIYPGKISRYNEDGTYDIVFDDGRSPFVVSLACMPSPLISSRR